MSLQNLKSKSKVIDISFGNPSNEIIKGELHVSNVMISKTVVMYDISTKYSLKEFCDFLSKESNLFKECTHLKVVNQQNSIYYCILCAFKIDEYAEQFLHDINGIKIDKMLSDDVCNAMFLINNSILMTKNIGIKSMDKNNNNAKQKTNSKKLTQYIFPPKTITQQTVPNILRQISNENDNKIDDDDDDLETNSDNHNYCRHCNDENCAFCLEPLHDHSTNHDNGCAIHMFGISKGKHINNSNELLIPMQPELSPSISGDDIGNKNSTLIFVLCNHVYHLECLMRCKKK